MKSLLLNGVKITPATMTQLHEGIENLVQKKERAFMVSGNIHGLNQAHKFPWLRDFYNRADIVRVDGAGVVVGARILGKTIPPRLTWADWGYPLAKFLAEKNISLFLLGGPIGAAEGAAKIMREHAPDITIVGMQHGYFKKEGPENDAVIEAINKAKPDVVIIGFGMPLQEKWIIANNEKIVPTLYLTSGAAFEYLSNSIKRCPEWMGKMGFEWLFRLGLEPRRMAKRYIWGNSIFMIRIVVEKLKMVVSGRTLKEV